VPEHLKKARPYQVWESMILQEHQRYRGKDKFIAQMLYLQLTRQWKFYGSTFFHAKYRPVNEGALHFKHLVLLESQWCSTQGFTNKLFRVR
jgi:hypothetical protein